MIPLLSSHAGQAEELTVTVTDLLEMHPTVPDLGDPLETGDIGVQFSGTQTGSTQWRGKAGIALTPERDVTLTFSGSGGGMARGMRGGVAIKFRF